MSKKEAVTLTDIYNEMGSMYSDLMNKMEDLRHQIIALQSKEKPAENADNSEIPNGDIPNTEYITITRDGVFIGDQPATQYLGQDIYNLDKLPMLLAQGSVVMEFEHNIGIKELHVLASETKGEYAEVGTPSAMHGGSAWCRMVFNDGRASAWVCCYANSASNCAQFCAHYCAYDVQRYGSTAFRASVFSSVGNIHEIGRDNNE